MIDTEAGLFTVAVFQDAAWASKALTALTDAGFPAEAITILAKETPEAAALIEKTFGSGGERFDLGAAGTVVYRGSLVDVLQGSARDLSKLGLAGTMRRVGFQSHDARIFEALTARGGVLVAIRSESRAADALALFHSYGGGNAAIGAWGGRV
jgi:hypothetical protein